MSKFKLGEKTRDVWCGDIVEECEFVCDYSQGRMIFYDIKSKCFRLAFYEECGYGKLILNGWKCASSISELLK